MFELNFKLKKSRMRTLRPQARLGLCRNLIAIPQVLLTLLLLIGAEASGIEPGTQIPGSTVPGHSKDPQPPELTLTEQEKDELAIRNLKAVMGAVHAYCEAHDWNLPPAVIANDALPAEKRLSGLVLLLPYLDVDAPENRPGNLPAQGKQNSGEALFAKIDLTKGWDDPANVEAGKTIVPQFLMPFGASTRSKNGMAHTHVALVRGSSSSDDGCFPLKSVKPVHLVRDISDGTSNTLAIGEVESELGPWLAAGNATARRLIHPRDKTQRPTFSSDRGSAAYFANADGSVFFLDIGETSPLVLSRMASVADGELLPALKSRFVTRSEWVAAKAK